MESEFGLSAPWRNDHQTARVIGKDSDTWWSLRGTWSDVDVIFECSCTESLKSKFGFGILLCVCSKGVFFNSKDPCLRLLPTVWAQENKMNKHVGWLPTVSSSCESSKVRLPWKRRLGLEEPTKLLLQSDLHAKPCANSPRTPATAGAVQQVQLRSVERLRSDR